VIFALFLLLFLFSRPTQAIEPTITDFWNNKANFRYSFRITEVSTGWPSGFDGGNHIETVGNTWYLFSRKVNWGNKPEYCYNTETMYTEIRKSTDFGKSWSEPVPAVANVPNSPWECAATDGDAYYNPTENRWHYLFQCLGRNNGWSGCYATRDGEDPYGPFTPALDNPTITSGEIWSKICNDPTDDCQKLSQGKPLNKVIDEGTFDIFDYQNNYYYLDFHGFDGVNGYRGIAKSTNFHDFIPVASDSTLDKNDSYPFTTTWDTNGPVGFGAGKIIKDQNYYYLISEGADKSIGCIPDQKWVVGMFRSSDISSVNWEQLPRKTLFLTSIIFPMLIRIRYPAIPPIVKSLFIKERLISKPQGQVMIKI